MSLSYILLPLLGAFVFLSCTTLPTVITYSEMGPLDKIQENKSIQSVYHFRYQEREFIGFPNVFSPAVFPISPVFASLPVQRGDKILEIGSGTGVLAVLAVLAGAERVVATDINKDAIANTVANAKLHGVAAKIETRLSDVYSAFSKDEKFDVIFWNIPDCHVARKDLSILERAVFDPDYRLLKRYLAESETHLTTNGRLLLGYSTREGEDDRLQDISSHYGWQPHILRKAAPAEGKVSIILYELRKVRS